MSNPLLLAVTADTLSRLERAAEYSAIAQGWMTVVGIAVAGLWTYQLFVSQRQRYPRASVHQTLLHRTLADGSQLITVCARLSNIGQRLIKVDKATVVVQRLAPLKGTLERDALRTHDPLDAARRREVLWYRVGHWSTGFSPVIEIEPGESEELYFDFRISPNETAVKIQTHIENEMKRHDAGAKSKTILSSIRDPQRWIGWQCTSYHNLGEGAPVLRVVPHLISEPRHD